MIIWVSPCLSFFLSTSTVATYIFIALTCTTSIIPLEPYALNDEFQHLITRFNKISSHYGYIERGVWGWKEAQKKGNFMKNLNIYIYTPQNIYMGLVRVFDKYLDWPSVSLKKYI